MKAANVRPMTVAMLELLAQSQDALTKTRRTFSTAEVRRRAKAALRRAASRK